MERVTACPKFDDVPADLKGVHFIEAAGKTVLSIRSSGDPDQPALEIRFTDGTFFWFELIPKIELAVRYMERRQGDVEMIRNYGFIQAED